MRHSSDYAKLIVSEGVREAYRAGRSMEGAAYHRTRVFCRASGCDRPFLGIPALTEHAEAVHTFDDIRRLLSDHLRETFGRSGDYNAEPPVPGIWVWIDDLATDWVVFSREEGNENTLLKADYSIDESNSITLGTPVEVVRRTVYDPVK